jgi:hypothetical protein
MSALAGMVDVTVKNTAIVAAGKRQFVIATILVASQVSYSVKNEPRTSGKATRKSRVKSSYAVAGLRSRRRSRGLQRRLVDKNQTSDFKAFCDKVEGAKNGDQLLQKQLSKKCEAAAFDLEKIAKNQETFVANLPEHAKNDTEGELKILRKGEPITPELFDKIAGQIFKLALWLFATHPYFKNLPDFKTLPNAFLFRFAVAGYVVALRCIKDDLAPKFYPIPSSLVALGLPEWAVVATGAGAEPSA